MGQQYRLSSTVVVPKAQPHKVEVQATTAQLESGGAELAVSARDGASGDDALA